MFWNNWWPRLLYFITGNPFLHEVFDQRVLHGVRSMFGGMLNLRRAKILLLILHYIAKFCYKNDNIASCKILQRVLQRVTKIFNQVAKILLRFTKLLFTEAPFFLQFSHQFCKKILQRFIITKLQIFATAF